jgi:hypothetical protein
MEEKLLDFASIDELREFVRHKLGKQENLLAEQFPLTEAKLRQGGKECGRQFVLHGPRSVRLTAIWVSAKNQLYFYDARGERCDKLDLAGPPRLEQSPGEAVPEPTVA